MRTQQDLNRLRWRCRRGTQELDILLMRFFDASFSALAQDEQDDFERLLANQDPDLQDWLFGRAAPEDPRMVHIVERIRSTPAA